MIFGNSPVLNWDKCPFYWDFEHAYLHLCDYVGIWNCKMVSESWTLFWLFQFFWKFETAFLPILIFKTFQNPQYLIIQPISRQHWFLIWIFHWATLVFFSYFTHFSHFSHFEHFKNFEMTESLPPLKVHRKNYGKNILGLSRNYQL